MSEVYIKEPSTKGKAIFRTTHGDLEIEMWSNEAPKACRNFCQLILEGYYNGSVFHRVIRDFCIQGGDPTGDGNSCESIYGKPYDDEIHPRLKFRYRGLMGVASAGRGTKTNGNQFFIVLNRASSLDGKHTLFAKVAGQTVYNLQRISEVDVDKNDRPTELPRIHRAELVWDPFEDLEPRVRAPPPLQVKAVETEHRRAPVRNKRVLSFAGGDGDEDGSSSGDDDKARRTGGKSAHDLLNDPKLLKGEAVARPIREPEMRPTGGGRRSDAKPGDSAPAASRGSSKPAVGAAKGAAKETRARKKAADSDSGSGSDSGDEDDESDDGKDDVALERSRRRQEEIMTLKRSIKGIGASADDEVAAAPKKAKSLLEEQREGYVTRTKASLGGKELRRRAAASVLDNLKVFQERLRKTVSVMEEEEAAKPPEEEDEATRAGETRTEKRRRDKDEHRRREEVTNKKEPEAGTFAAIWQEGEEESDKNWLSGGGLKFHASGDKAFKMAAMKARDNLEIFDPLTANGNAEVLADARKKRSEQLRPSLRRPQETAKW